MDDVTQHSYTHLFRVHVSHSKIFSGSIKEYKQISLKYMSIKMYISLLYFVQPNSVWLVPQNINKHKKFTTMDISFYLSLSQTSMRHDPHDQNFNVDTYLILITLTIGDF